MKEIMGQYGQCVIAAMIAILLLAIIGGISADKTIYAQTGQYVSAPSVTTGENAEFERYWRVR